MFQYYLTRAAFYWKKILVVLLLGISVYELYEVTKFFLIEYPELEAELAIHAVNAEHIQELMAGAIAESIVSGLNIFFAVRLHKVGEKLVELFDLISSSGLVVLHNPVVNWLSTFDYVAIWQRFW